MVETFHNSITPFLVQEASAQKSWRLGTGATSSPGLTAGHSLGGGLSSGPNHRASQSGFLCICSLMNSSSAVREIGFIPVVNFYTSLEIFPRSSDGEADRWSLRKGLGLLSNMSICEKFTASIFNALKAPEVTDTVSENLRRKLKSIQIHAQCTTTDTHAVGEREPSKPVSFPLDSGICSAKAISL